MLFYTQPYENSTVNQSRDRVESVFLKHECAVSCIFRTKPERRRCVTWMRRRRQPEIELLKCQYGFQLLRNCQPLTTSLSWGSALKARVWATFSGGALRLCARIESQTWVWVALGYRKRISCFAPWPMPCWWLWVSMVTEGESPSACMRDSIHKYQLRITCRPRCSNAVWNSKVEEKAHQDFLHYRSKV